MSNVRSCSLETCEPDLARSRSALLWLHRGREEIIDGKEGRREGRPPQTSVQKQSAVHLRPASDVHGTAQEDAGCHQKQVSAIKDVRTSVGPVISF